MQPYRHNALVQPLAKRNPWSWKRLGQKLALWWRGSFVKRHPVRCPTCRLTGFMKFGHAYDCMWHYIVCRNQKCPTRSKQLDVPKSRWYQARCGDLSEYRRDK